MINIQALVRRFEVLSKPMVRRIDGVINPIAVKELRQAVQGKFVMGILLLFLTVAVVILGVVSLLYEENAGDFTTGRYIFQVFLGLLLGTCMLFLPNYVGMRISTERTGGNVDLLYATTLRAGAIIRGKLLSATILCVIMYSVCTPFMTLTYLLRGIDLPSIFFMLTMSFLFMILVIQAAIFLSCFSFNRGFMMLVGLGALTGLFFLFIGAMVLAEELLRSGVGSMMTDPEFWLGVGSILGVSLMGFGQLYLLSVALISPGTTNRALPVRVYMTAMWLISGIACLLCARHYSLYEIIFAWGITALILFMAAFYASISEREKLGPRVAKTIPKRLWLRAPCFLFYSGSAGGVLWSGLILMGTLAVMMYSMRFFGWLPMIDRSYTMAALNLDTTCTCLYVVAYGLIGVFIRRKLLRRWVEPIMTWAVSVLVLCIFSLAPLITAFLMRIQVNENRDYMWFLSMPGAVFGFHKFSDIFLMTGTAMLGIGLIINVRWFMQQVRQFRPYVMAPRGPMEAKTE
jgi:hypothetical protein